MSKTNIFLVGPMGAGKTTVGKRLAETRGMEFIDSDNEIEIRTGVDIPLIFEKEGEAGFRQREREVIADLVKMPNIVLSTGGGAVLLPENREALKSLGTVFYLETSIGQQTSRVRSGHQQRPLLMGTDDPGARLAALMTERLPLYLSTADYTVRTDGRRVQAVAEEIIDRMQGAPAQA